MISVHFQGKPFNITVTQVYAPTSNSEEAEVEQFYEDLQDLLELTPKKDVLFIIGDWNEKVGSQETPGVTGKFGLGIRNEAGQRLIEFCRENALVIANTPFQQHKRRTYKVLLINKVIETRNVFPGTSFPQNVLVILKAKNIFCTEMICKTEL